MLDHDKGTIYKQYYSYMRWKVHSQPSFMPKIRLWLAMPHSASGSSAFEFAKLFVRFSIFR